MRIVRPYGSSRSRKKDQALSRVLVENTLGRAERDIPEFARSRDELVIAQWISTIDKIARKPAGRNKPTPAQRAFREKLGNACWLQITDGGHLPGATGGDREYLNTLWWFKIHPYPHGTEEPRRRRNGSLPRSAEVKGRWFEVFAGDYDPENTNPHGAAEIIAETARRIEKHLYEGEYRLGPTTRPKRQGRIEARAESIKGNVLRVATPDEARKNQPTWSEEDKKAYVRPGDPAKAIRQEAEALEARRGRMSLPVAAKVLFDHWSEVFPDQDTGEPMRVRDARERHPGMFALHDALKQCYRRLLKRTRKDTREHRKENRDGRKLSTLLPRDLDAALRLVGMQAANAELAELVRLGKVIHYAASEGRADRTKTIKERWPANVSESRFWQSDGQAEVKRAEAFVRIWRQALVLAGLTLKDWVSFTGDILGGDRTKSKVIQKAIEALRTDRSRWEHFDQKLNVLFGARADLLGVGSTDDRIELLCGLIDGAANLRHAIFHFKGRGQLLDELAKLPGYLSAPIKEAAERLFQADVTDRTSRLKAVLIGAHVEEFLTQEQAAQVFTLIAGDAVAELPVPRFSRVLQRRKNAWAKAIRLPEPANLRALEVPARQCQYTLLKLVYERGFRSWLKQQDANAISSWIDRAVERATEAAKALNPTGDEASSKVIAARAADLPRPSAGSDITEFFFDLSAATASEMRVQSGYESDPEKAREQAAYIDDLLCDVMILAFDAYLAQAKLDWLLDVAPDRPATCSVAELPEPEREFVAEPWQWAFYLVLHLLPVESVGQLLHQLFRWKIAAGRDIEWTEKDQARLQRLFAVMTLYLDMHDAKFRGSHSLVGTQEFAILFESEAGFRRVFPLVLDEKAELRIPRRGLREVVRFGHLPLLKAISGSKKIDDAAIERVFTMEALPESGESQIARLQARREELHHEWIEAKEASARRHQPDGDRVKSFGAQQLREYCETLASVSNHRQQSNFVNLVDHVRAYRLVLAVFARLVDYMGLFERDLYFVTLALLHQKHLHPKDVLEEDGLENLYNGQIIFALREHKKELARANEILDMLSKHFAKVWEPRSSITAIRNRLAHLDMNEGANVTPRLTDRVNETRELMSYDRKLKNAVSKSVIELLAREGIKLNWTIRIDRGAHNLADGQLSSRCAEHLGSKKLTLKGAGSKDKGAAIAERFHSDNYVTMIAAAFDGNALPMSSILDNLGRVDWEASVQERPGRREPGGGGLNRRPPGRRFDRGPQRPTN
jgi:hypothetical protein